MTRTYNCPVCDEEFDHEYDVEVYFCDFCLARLELCADADCLDGHWVDYTSVREIKSKWYDDERSKLQPTQPT